MPETKPEPLYNAGRRIKLLGLVVVATVIILSGLWFHVAGRLDKSAAAFIEAQQAAGIAISCPQRTVRGFPFRFGIFCDSVTVDQPLRGFSASAGAFRSAAQFYEPSRIIAELDAPIAIDGLGNQPPITANWSSARAAIKFADPVPSLVSVNGWDVEMTLAGQPQASAKQVDLHMRTSGDTGTALDLSGRAQGVSVAGEISGGIEWPAFDSDIDFTIDDGTQFLVNGKFAQPTVTGDIRRLAVLLNDDAGILVSGPFQIGPLGRIDGTFQLRIVDVDAVKAALQAALPQASDQLALIDTLPRSGEKNDEVSLTLNAVEGRLRFGLIPIATLPFVSRRGGAAF